MLLLRDIQNETFHIPLRRPFRFGMVELNELEHRLIRCAFEIDGRSAEGIAGENLVPKWFTKDVRTSLGDDVSGLRCAIESIGHLALALPPVPTPFDFWRKLYERVAGYLPTLPGLVRQLGVSLFERCAIDAWCRHARRPFFELLRNGSLGFKGDGVYPQLSGESVALALPAAAAHRLAVRHTIGLADTLHTLAGDLGSSGITRLKIKLGGDIVADLERLAAIAAQVQSLGIELITLDGNENFSAPEALREFLDRFTRAADVAPIRDRLAWIEQPLRRDLALTDSAGAVLRAFADVPQIIDESDSDKSALPRALELGYAGTTHKNCKGVFKSVAANMLLARHTRRTSRATILSGEDLTIVAPWSQAQDLAVAAAAGVVDIERNGQHFADGLSAFDRSTNALAAANYPDLYDLDEKGVACLKIMSGHVSVESVNASGFAGRW